MKVSPKILALMAAMAAGVAGAAAPTANPNGYTSVGQPIDNSATANYTNPNYNSNNPNDPQNPPTLTSTSNKVTTIVQPLPNFDIVYDDKPDGSGDANNSANSATVDTPNKQDANPGETKSLPYYLVNNGNTPLTVSIVPSGFTTTQPTNPPTGSTPSPVIDKTNVTYDFSNLPTGAKATAHTNGDGGYDVVLPVNSVIGFTQKITVPSGALPGTIYGATPVGTVEGKGTAAVGKDGNGNPIDADKQIVNGIASGQTLHENQSVSNGSGVAGTYGNPNRAAVGVPEVGNNSFADNDKQFEAILIKPAGLTNTPDKTPPGTPTTTPPTGTPPGDGHYDGGTPPPTTGTGTPPDGGKVPGPTPIVISGDQQVAYPPADDEKDRNNPDVVVFTNTITNGAGNPADTVTLTPGKPSADGKTATDTNGATWTKDSTVPGKWTDGNGNTVQFLDPTNKTPIDTVTVGANGGSANYITQVTYPDSNPHVGTTTLDNPKPVTVIITTTSGNNPNVSDTTTDIIYPAAANFGDTAAQTGSKGVSATNPDTKVTTVTGGYIENPDLPYGPTNSGVTNGAATPDTLIKTAPGATASFPMSIANTGQYPDTYTLAGTVTIKLNDGTNKVVPIVYKDSAGAVITTTLAVQPGQAINITATVDVPADAAATTAAGGSNPAPTLQQTATGVSSKIVMHDNNDPLPIAPSGKIVVGKFTQTKNANNPAANVQFAAGSPVIISNAAPTNSDPYVNNPAGYDGRLEADKTGTDVGNTSYQPGVNYSYQIIAKNGYNADIPNFYLSDTLNNALTYISATCSNGTANFAKDATEITVNSKQVVIPANTVYCSPTTLPQGGTANLTITVSIK